MAYLHFRMINADFGAKFQCRLDGIHDIFFKNGEYIKIDAGKHLITFDGGGAEWNVQDTVSENECLDIELMVGFNDSYGYKTVMGTPEYKICELDDDMIEFIEDGIKELAEEREAKSKRNLKRFLIVTGVVIGFIWVCGLVSLLLQ